MRIGVIGAGKIGGTLGGRWEAAGHEVLYGLREPAKRKGARSIEEAPKAGEIVHPAIPGKAVVDFVRQHVGGLDDKPIIEPPATTWVGPR